MCRTYDSAECVDELASKEQVRSCVEVGWRCTTAWITNTTNYTNSVCSIKTADYATGKSNANSRGSFSKRVLLMWTCTTTRRRPARHTKCRARFSWRSQVPVEICAFPFRQLLAQHKALRLLRHMCPGIFVMLQAERDDHWGAWCVAVCKLKRDAWNLQPAVLWR